RAVQVVAAAFGDLLNFAANRGIELNASVVGLPAELFETFDWRGDDRSRGSHKTRVISAGTFHIAGGIATVDHESVLVSAHTSNAAAAGVSFAVSRSRSAVETWCGHRLQKHQRSGVTTQAGHIGQHT